MPKKIVILHQGIDGNEDPTIVNAVRLRDNLVTAIAGLGYVPQPVYLDERFQWVSRIMDFKPDLVFNVADLGFFYDNTYEPNIPAVLDGIGTPYTGSDCYSMSFSSDKFASKVYLRTMGIPTPACFLLEGLSTGDLSYPLILKRRKTHNSVGLSFDSIVNNAQDLERKLGEVKGEEKEWILEEFIDGPEINASFIGNGQKRLMLPNVMIEYGEFFEGKPRICEYTSKWAEGSDAYTQNIYRPANLPKETDDKVYAYLRMIVDFFDIKDYVRLDFRIGVSPEGLGEPYIIDINANPDINDDAGVYKMARQLGYDYKSFIGLIIDAAFERTRK